jgi:ABC-type multidrug transport system fused ATPase/permease subunit/CRP-like cAMP-binding protein
VGVATKIRINEGAEERVVEVDGRIEVGRECDGLHVDDLKASRRHLALEPHPDGLVVEDLGSANGTQVNGVVLTGPVLLRAGDVVTLGAVTIRVEPSIERDGVEGQAQASPGRSAPTTSVSVPVAPPAPVEAPAASVRSALGELAAKDVGAAIIRYRPGSHGERIAGAVGASARAARRRLIGFGSEAWGQKPQICLVDPFEDPANPGQMLTGGTLVDSVNGEIWMVVTPESPPEPLERALTLLFGAAFPAAADLDVLLEGYGLFLAEQEPDEALAEIAQATPESIDRISGDERSLLARSFVAFLIKRSGQEEFLGFLAAAQPGRVETTAQSVFGAGLASLEESWRQRLAAGEPDVRAGEFVRLSLPYLRPHLLKQVEIFLYMLLGLGFTMAFPFVFREFVDSALPSGEFAEVAKLLVVLGVVFAISLLAELRRSYLSAFVSGSIVRDIRMTMFGRLQDLSTGWFSSRNQGDVLSRMFSDVGQMESGISDVLREGIFQMLSLVVACVVLFLLNPVLAVVVILGAPVVAIVYRVMSTGARDRSLAVQEEIGAVYGLATENYSAQDVVKAFALQDRERERFARSSSRLFKQQVRLMLFGGYFGLSVNMIVTLLRIGVLALGARLVFDGNLTIGGLVAFMGLMGEVIGPVTALTSMGQQLQAASGSLHRVSEILDIVPDIIDAPNAVRLAPLQREIRFSGVSFSYTSERQTLSDLECTIAAGARVAFVGPTGAGKSSVLRLLMRSYDVDAGAILFDGQDIRQATIESLRGQIGVVFQESFLFDGTIRENIALGRPGASDADIEAAARAAEVHDFVSKLPRGYDTLVGERGGRLSGGQRQRVSIARALLRDPRVLVLDEATSALDPRTERLISDTLERVSHGRTTVAVTHRLTSIVDYDRIFVLVDGRLAEQGTHDELVAMGGTYWSLWSEQTGGDQGGEPSFDAVAAVGRVSLFAGLDGGALQGIAEHLRPLDLRAGERLDEGGGLVFVQRGQPTVLTATARGARVPVASLAVGDAFGLSAVLGQATGAALEADGATRLLLLDDDALRAIAAQLPSVAAALRGDAPGGSPTDGRRLTRLTLTVADTVARAGAPVGDLSALRSSQHRLSAVLPAVRVDQ